MAKRHLRSCPKFFFSCLHGRSAAPSCRVSFLTEFFTFQLPTSRSSRAIFNPLHSPAAAFLLRNKHCIAPCDLCCSALQGSAVVAQKPSPVIIPGLRQPGQAEFAKSSLLTELILLVRGVPACPTLNKNPSASSFSCVHTHG